MTTSPSPRPSWIVDVALATSRAPSLAVSVPSLASALVEWGPADHAWVWSRGSTHGRLLWGHIDESGVKLRSVGPKHPVMAVGGAPKLVPAGHPDFVELGRQVDLRGGEFLLVPVLGFAVIQLHAKQGLEASADTIMELVSRLLSRTEATDPGASLEGQVAIPNHLFAEIVEYLPSMLFVKDAQTLEFVFVNRVAEALIGYSRNELLGKNDEDFFPPKEAAFFTANDRQVLLTGQMQDIYEEPIQTKNGERFLHTKKIPLLDEDGQPAYLLGISDDITEHRRARDQLARMHGELEERVAARTADLESAYDELESFVHAVSHDLRGPVRVIHSFTEILRDERGEALGDAGRSLVDSILGACARLETLFEGILGMARISSTPVTRELVSISETAARIAAHACQMHDVQVSVYVEPDLECEADAPMLELLLANLINNALKFSVHAVAPRIEVTQTCEFPPTWCVKDNGVGFDMARADRLFTPFQRLHDAKEFPGTGIGLATAARIVNRHGGRIWAEAAPNEGARFYFTLSASTPTLDVGQ